MVHEELVSVRS